MAPTEADRHQVTARFGDPRDAGQEWMHIL
jgi:hypothetical protein